VTEHCIIIGIRGQSNQVEQEPTEAAISIVNMMWQNKNNSHTNRKINLTIRTAGHFPQKY